MPLSAPGFRGKVGGGAIHLSPDGRVLYATNRGDANEIVIYSVDADNGRLSLVGRQSSLGSTSRRARGAGAVPQSVGAGASTSRLPLTPIDDTSEAASICSTKRAARL